MFAFRELVRVAEPWKVRCRFMLPSSLCALPSLGLLVSYVRTYWRARVSAYLVVIIAIRLAQAAAQLLNWYDGR